MLSYRHSFHAGNHADVLKHLVLLGLFKKLCAKDKAFSYIDSHSGAGMYDLLSSNALMNAEYESGISRLWQRDLKHSLLQDYLACVASFNEDGQLRFYPGSPAFALWSARSQDRLQLLDLQPEELGVLQYYLGRDERVSIHQRDAFEGLLALTPPEPRRGLALIDPSFEQKEDYQRVVSVAKKVMRRWPVGIMAIWYPILASERDRSAWLKAALHREKLSSVTSIELRVAEQAQEYGMHGSGMLLINTPWQFSALMQDVLEEAVPLLGDNASFLIETLTEAE
tara:strand:- start:72 stop:917 length:846 start_codon:yes stop_codon:yes gene_type:complete